VLLMVSTMVPVYANNDIKVKIDGAQVNFDVQPQAINGRTMVPLRAIFEALGATVDWDNNTQTVTSKKGDVTINLTLNNPVMYVNGTPVALDAAACAIDGRTLVPVRAISEAFNLKVDWDNDTKTVLISTGTAVAPEVVNPGANVHPTNFNNLKNLLIREGIHASADDPAYSIYKKLDESNGMLITYDPEMNYISLFLKTVYEDGEYGALVIIYQDEDPQVLSSAESAGFPEEKIYGYFPANGKFRITENTSIVPDSFVGVVNAQFTVMDIVFEMETGYTFADFGMYYDKAE